MALAPTRSRHDVVGPSIEPGASLHKAPVGGGKDVFHDPTTALCMKRMATSDRLAAFSDGMVSFEPEKVEITIDDQKLEPVPGQTVLAHGPDRNLGVDEVGGIDLVENESPARARGMG